MNAKRQINPGIINPKTNIPDKSVVSNNCSNGEKLCNIIIYTVIEIIPINIKIISAINCVPIKGL